MFILPFPAFRQTYDYDCGATVVQGVLAYYGIDMRADKIMKEARTTQRDGTETTAMKAVLSPHGLKMTSKRMTVAEVKQYLDKKIPVILLLQAWTDKKDIEWKDDWEDGHYVVAIGYDKTRLYFADPSSIFRTYLTYEELKERWHGKGDSGEQRRHSYGLAVFGQKPVYRHTKTIHMD